MERQLEGKYKFFKGIIIAIFLILGLRLATLQLLEAPVYKTKAELNQFRFLPIRAPRGEIVDRNGRILVGSKIVNIISLVRQETADQDLKETVRRLASLLQDVYPEIDVAYIEEQLAKQRVRPYEPVVIKRDVSMEVVSRLEERRRELPGVVIRKEIVRFYPWDSLASHVLGYVGEISSEELEKLGEENYKLGDLIGRFGLEAQYEKYLRGQDGFQQVEVDVTGRPISHKELIAISPRQGHRLVLTLDYDLQKVLEESMDQVLTDVQKKYVDVQAGAAVVLDVRTGAVLAMASRPDFDPNELVPPVAKSTVQKYITPPSQVESPMVNRVISSRYPPGSTFKPITGMAALESGRVTPEDRVTCKGSYWLDPFTKCWKVHGAVDFFRAMAGSCNVFFIEAGRRAGAEMIAKIAREFGLETPTGVDLPGEVSGLLSSPSKKRAENTPKWEQWYSKELAELEKRYSSELTQVESLEERQRILARKRDDEWRLRDLYQANYRSYVNWRPYETFNMSIGQGSNEFTPIELANCVAALANGGKRMRPFLVQRIEDHQGRVVTHFGPKVVHRVKVSERTMATVWDAMIKVTEPGGTASWLFHNFPVKVAAKTGTAESGRGKEQYHGLFVAFAPAEKPEIAFAGIIEYGYHGSESAGLVAKEVFTQYFGLNKDDKQQATGTGAVRRTDTPGITHPVEQPPPSQPRASGIQPGSNGQSPSPSENTGEDEPSSDFVSPPGENGQSSQETPPPNEDQMPLESPQSLFEPESLVSP